MLKIRNDIDLKELEKFGFHSYKLNRNQTNFYRCFANGGNLIIVNNINKEIYIEKWYENDSRIHKIPKCHYRDKTQLVDCLFDIINANLVEKVSE